MLNHHQRQSIADSLDHAVAAGVPIPLPSRTYTDFSLDDAYQVQELWANARVAKCARHIGYKVGLTSRAMQEALKVDEPHYGHLFDTGLYQDGAQIAVERFLRPKLELEIGFVIGADLQGPDLQTSDVLRATESVRPALEIVDYRTEVPRSAADMVADNTAGAGAILGSHVISPMEIDLRWVGAILSKNGIIVESGVSAAVMGHPAAGVAALANWLTARGKHLAKGQLVLAGSFTRQVDVGRGDVILADYGPLGTIRAAFV